MNDLFATISTIALLATTAVLAFHFLYRGLRARKTAPPATRYNLWEKLVHLGLTFSFLSLAITGFWPALLNHAPLGGYLLMIHVTLGGVFAGCLAAMTLTWAAANRFAPDAPRFDLSEKFFFWLIALLGLIAVMTMMLSMIPLFGSDGLNLLNELHRYTALAMVVATIIHLYQTTLLKPRRWQSLVRVRELKDARASTNGSNSEDGCESGSGCASRKDQVTTDMKK